ncbi:hypothetical protein KO488_13720 [Poseidonibacter lekithochrous]|uniref:hypothetical protein n=1 Tax=Poseidonibacter TaxID=2321187 RepID=UPI001C084083|nr:MULTISPECIES: hypothetical protein [Poseidonibacter]MBU3015821.1 hypothetical protein [Poseidonibacter lekithochrous]MDO6829121.1 hypothetical protein [Poseidonibacter sp. 1_MG-2023]
MLAMSLVSTATNIVIGSVTTKIFDTVITSRLTQKQEKNKWLREKKLNLFSQLSEKILTINCQNIADNRIHIKEISSKIMLLTEDINLQKNLQNYTFILEEYECYENDINLQNLNNELISTLSTYMKRM